MRTSRSVSPHCSGQMDSTHTEPSGWAIGRQFPIQITGSCCPEQLIVYLAFSSSTFICSEKVITLSPSTLTRSQTDTDPIIHGRYEISFCSQAADFSIINCLLRLFLTSMRYAIGLYLPRSVSEHLIQFGESQLVPKSKLPQIIQAVIRFVPLNSIRFV